MFNVINLQTSTAATGEMPAGFLDAVNTALAAANIPLTAAAPASGVNGYRFLDGDSQTVARVIGTENYEFLSPYLTVDSVQAQNYAGLGSGSYPTIIFNGSVVAVLCRATINAAPSNGYFITKTNAGTIVFVGSANSSEYADILRNPYSIASGDDAVLGATITPAQAQGTFTGYYVPYTGGEYCEHIAYCPFASAVATDTKPGTISGTPAYLVGGAWIITD